jgi:hypothetical protein
VNETHVRFHLLDVAQSDKKLICDRMVMHGIANTNTREHGNVIDTQGVQLDQMIHLDLPTENQEVVAVEINELNSYLIYARVICG